jgi:hypothetical protein
MSSRVVEGVIVYVIPDVSGSRTFAGSATVCSPARDPSSSHFSSTVTDPPASGTVTVTPEV